MVQATAGPLRPPSEARSLLVRVTKNCPWNRCEFCSVFKGEKFELRTVEEVKGDILAAKRVAEELRSWAERTGHGAGDVARYNGVAWLQDDGVKSVFLQDSDSLIMKMEPLVEILEFLRETFPTVERICSYARGKTLTRKRAETLRKLREAGLSRLHIGLETGDDELLKYVKKGASAVEMVEAGRKAVEAGFEVSEYVMPGLGGRERWKQHAENTAQVLNRINPHFIRLRTFHVAAASPIYEKVKRGELSLQSIEGVLLEIRSFLEQLEVTSEFLTTDHVANYFLGEVDGKLPRDKEKLLSLIDDSLAWWRRKGEPGRNPFLRNLTRTAV